ncbi:S1 family peptidase [Streptomyces sp. NPDC001118]
MKDTGRSRRRAVTAIPVAALALSLPFIASPAAGASAQPPGSAAAKAAAVAGKGRPVTDPRIIALEKKQEVLDKIAGQITEGLSESDRARIPGFTEIEVDPDHNSLRLHWKGSPPQRVQRILAHLPRGVTASVLSARYSKADLHAARNKLLHGGKPVNLRVAGVSTPIRITSLGAAVDGSGLDITYADALGPATAAPRDPLASAARKDRSREVKVLIDRLTGINTAASYKAPPTETPTPTVPARHPAPASPRVGGLNRQHDAAPWTGGSGLKNPTGGICSSGFGVKNYKGVNMLTTAAHCNGNDGLWRTYLGGDAVGSSDGRELSTADDVQGIDLPKPQLSGSLYDGTAMRFDYYAKPVSGWGHNNVGDYVCEDGANGGVHCNIKIAQTDVPATGANGVLRPITDLAYATSLTPDGIAGVNGDSGAPVFAGANNFTTDEARGTLTAFDTTVTCPSDETSSTVTDGWQRTPWCFKGLYYVPIYQTLQDMNWTLVTS